MRQTSSNQPVVSNQPVISNQPVFKTPPRNPTPPKIFQREKNEETENFELPSSSIVMNTEIFDDLENDFDNDDNDDFFR